MNIQSLFQINACEVFLVKTLVQLSKLVQRNNIFSVDCDTPAKWNELE